MTNSITPWGLVRAERYLLDLNTTLEHLAQFPELGRDIQHLRPSYFQFTHGSHNVFYKRTQTGILVVRVLHRRQQPGTYL